MVGGTHNFNGVLDHDDRVPLIANPPHHTQQLFHVARVQADGRFIEHI